MISEFVDHLEGRTPPDQLLTELEPWVLPETEFGTRSLLPSGPAYF